MCIYTRSGTTDGNYHCAISGAIHLLYTVPVLNEPINKNVMSYAEETIGSISGRPDLIDEEILDLRIQVALSEETVGTKQEQQMDSEIEPSNEEQD